MLQVQVKLSFFHKRFLILHHLFDAASCFVETVTSSNAINMIAPNDSQLSLLPPPFHPTVKSMPMNGARKLSEMQFLSQPSQSVKSMTCIFSSSSNSFNVSSCYYSTIASAANLEASSPPKPCPPSIATRPKSNDKDNKGAMDDEYGTMNSAGKTYKYPSPYYLESFGTFGHYTAASNAKANLPRGVLDPAFINYNTYGSLNATRDNVLVVCHALTGNASLEAWWGDLLGPGKAFDTDRYFVVCCNILGSCYGSCGPESLRPGFDTEEASIDGIATNIPKNKHGQPIYGIDFPDVSVRDTVRLQLLLLKNELKVNSVKCVIGGSFGGMQVMEYCVMAGATRPLAGSGVGSGAGGGIGDGVGLGGKNGGMGVPYGIGEFVTKRNGRIEPFVRSAVPIACGAAHTAWQIVSVVPFRALRFLFVDGSFRLIVRRILFPASFEHSFIGNLGNPTTSHLRRSEMEKRTNRSP